MKNFLSHLAAALVGAFVYRNKSHIVTGVEKAKSFVAKKADASSESKEG